MLADRMANHLLFSRWSVSFSGCNLQRKHVPEYCTVHENINDCISITIIIIIFYKGK